MDPKRQYHPLTKFGGTFLNRFQCASTNSDVLKGISIFEKYPKEYQKALKPVNHGLTENHLKPWPHPYR